MARGRGPRVITLTGHSGFSFLRVPENIFAVGFALKDLGLHSSQLPERKGTYSLLPHQFRLSTPDEGKCRPGSLLSKAVNPVLIVPMSS